MNPKDEIKIVVVGSGTAIPVKDHSPASILIQAHNFSTLLDLGPGALSKLPLYNIDILTVENIFLTHFHPDHSLDLATLFLIFDYNISQLQNKIFNLTGPTGIKNFTENFIQLFPDVSIHAELIHFHEMSEDKINFKGCRVSSILSGHTLNSISYRMEFDNATIVYTSDCVYSKKLENFCSNADLLITECSYPEGWVTTDHLTSKEVGLLARNANVSQLIITHLYQPALEVDIQSQIAKNYSGEIRLALDGETIWI